VTQETELWCEGVAESHNGACRTEVNYITSSYSVGRRLSRHATEEGSTSL